MKTLIVSLALPVAWVLAFITLSSMNLLQTVPAQDVASMPPAVYAQYVDQANRAELPTNVLFGAFYLLLIVCPILFGIGLYRVLKDRRAKAAVKAK